MSLWRGWNNQCNAWSHWRLRWWSWRNGSWSTNWRGMGRDKSRNWGWWNRWYSSLKTVKKTLSWLTVTPNRILKVLIILTLRIITDVRSTGISFSLQFSRRGCHLSTFSQFITVRAPKFGSLETRGSHSTWRCNSSRSSHNSSKWRPGDCKTLFCRRGCIFKRTIEGRVRVIVAYWYWACCLCWWRWYCPCSCCAYCKDNFLRSIWRGIMAVFIKIGWLATFHGVFLLFW